MYNIIDLFSGVGGLSLGFNQNGFLTTFANDNDPAASETFQKNHKGIPFIEKDIENVKENEIKELIENKKTHVLMGGFPCQSFSMAGYRNRKGIDNTNDPRHFLYKQFFRILDITNPDIAVIENVKGIISANKGTVLNAIIDSFLNRGYSVDYQSLNAANFGVPQIRERVFVIANKINQQNNFPEETNEDAAVGKVFDNLNSGIANHKKKELSGVVLERVKLVKQGENWKSLPEHMRTKSVHSGAYGRIDPNQPSRTLTTRFDTPPGGYVTHPTEHRALTVREGARIQTFPDSFVFYGTRSQQYRQVGNAVPVKLAYEVSKGIKQMLDSHYNN